MTRDSGALTPREAARLLRAALATLHAESSALLPTTLDWHPAEGEWCAKEVLGHLIEAERRGFAGRIRNWRCEAKRRRGVNCRRGMLRHCQKKWPWRRMRGRTRWRWKRIV